MRFYDNDATKDFLCILHKDMPQEVVDDIRYNDDYNKSFPTRFIGNAIGDCSQTWQEELFYKVVKMDDKGRRLGILAKCLWRSKTLVYQFSTNNVMEIIESIGNVTKYMANKSEFDERTGINLSSNLEVLLALLRLRNDENGNPNKEMRDILSIEKNEDLNSILNSLKVINKKILECGIGIKTRLKIENTDSFSSIKTPPLILAAARFIEGNKNSKSIKIVSVQDEE